MQGYAGPFSTTGHHSNSTVHLALIHVSELHASKMVQCMIQVCSTTTVHYSIVLHIFISINTALINLRGLTGHRELVDMLCLMSSARPHRKQTAVNVPTTDSIIPYIARKTPIQKTLGREIVKRIPKQPKTIRW